MTCSDACPEGMGSFASNRIFWHYRLLSHLIGKFSINLLEFIAAAVTIVLCMKMEGGHFKMLKLTDNASALAWLYKASFYPITREAHNKVAQWLAKI